MTEVTELEKSKTVSDTTFIIRTRHEFDKYGNEDGFTGPFATHNDAVAYLHELYPGYEDDDDELLAHLDGADGPLGDGVNSIQIVEVSRA